MATKHEVKGVTAKKKKPVIVPVEDDPENQWISKEQFLKKRAAQKAANIAAEEARRKVLAEHGVAPSTPQEAKPSQQEEKLNALRKKLAYAESKLAEKPDSKSWKVKVSEIAEELEAAEAESE